jgi:hypothetical protein
MNPAGSFEVFFSGKMQDRVRRLLSLAVGHGCGPRVLVALNILQYRLGIDPRTWGDPVCHYPAAEVMAHRVVHDELAVNYVVHDHRPQVWVTKIVPVLSHPLCGLDELDED